MAVGERERESPARRNATGQRKNGGGRRDELFTVTVGSQETTGNHMGLPASTRVPRGLPPRHWMAHLETTSRRWGGEFARPVVAAWWWRSSKGTSHDADRCHRPPEPVGCLLLARGLASVGPWELILRPPARQLMLGIIRDEGYTSPSHDFDDDSLTNSSRRWLLASP